MRSLLAFICILIVNLVHCHGSPETAVTMPSVMTQDMTTKRLIGVPDGHDNHDSHVPGAHAHPADPRTEDRKGSEGSNLKTVDEAGSSLGVLVRCANCSSRLADEGKECETHPEKFVIDCTQDAWQGSKMTGCWKIEQWVDYDIIEDHPDNRLKRHHIFIRRCGYAGDNMERDCYKKAGLGGRQTVCWCKGDGCNSANLLGGAGITALISTLLSALILNYFRGL